MHTEITKSSRCGRGFAVIQETKPSEVCGQKRFSLKIFDSKLKLEKCLFQDVYYMYINHYTRSMSIHGTTETIKIGRSKLTSVLRTMKSIQLALCFRGYTYGNNEIGVVL